MARFALTGICFIFCCFTLGCGPASSAVKSTHQPAGGDIMDTSTWDFGEIEVEDNDSILKQPQQVMDQFAIVVGTFTGDSHEAAAEATRSQLLLQFPTVGQHVTRRPRSRGSVLTFGDYEGYSDAKAKQDMRTLRAIRTPNGGQLFAQVLLMKFKAPVARTSLHPYDLWTVRREFPTLVPIFTLEVAIWGDFDSGQFPRERRRAMAEGYASELRKKGFEAFFYHNDEAELSSVTVGLFGYNAVDAETGFYNPEVEAMLSRFPSRLVNGEEVHAYFNPAKPELGSNIQPPCLAEVPVD